MSATGKIQVAIVDDHALLRHALARLIASFDNYEIIFEAGNGRETKEKISRPQVPDILLVDVNMPEMNGYETVNWLCRNYPQVRVMGLSMFSDELTIIRMLGAGARGYILKSIDPMELKNALDTVWAKNFYLSYNIFGKITISRPEGASGEDEIFLSDREKEFLRLVSSAAGYREIATKMLISPREVEEFRISLFSKLNVQSRVGLVVYALQHGLTEICGCE